MSIKNECRGCELRIQYGHKKECKITPSNVKDIKDCPCKKCLVKVSCTTICKDFSKVRDKIIRKYKMDPSNKINIMRGRSKGIWVRIEI